MQYRPKGTRDVAIDLIKDKLRRLDAGCVLTYKELSAVAGYAVFGNSHAVQRARHELLHEERIGTAPVRGEGIRRLTSEQIVELSSAGRRAVRRKAGREVRKLQAADIGSIEHKLQVEAAFNLGVLGALSVMLHGARCAAMLQHTNRASDLPPPRELMRKLLE